MTMLVQGYDDAAHLPWSRTVGGSVVWTCILLGGSPFQTR